MNVQTKSPWNIFLRICVLASAASFWRGFIFLLSSLRQTQFPTYVPFGQEEKTGLILMYVAPFFPSLLLGMIAANTICWLLPWSRQALDREAGENANLSYVAKTRALAKWFAILLILTAPIAIFGALSNW